jgi:K+/H+ antiporter YhaU regulatory subunit KhtT
MQFNPSPEDSLHTGDQLVVLGDANQLKALAEAAGGGKSRGGRDMSPAVR